MSAITRNVGPLKYTLIRTTNENLFNDFLERLRGWQNLGTVKTIASDLFQSLLLRMAYCHKQSVLLELF